MPIEDVLRLFHEARRKNAIYDKLQQKAIEYYKDLQAISEAIVNFAAWKKGNILILNGNELYQINGITFLLPAIEDMKPTFRYEIAKIVSLTHDGLFEFGKYLRIIDKDDQKHYRLATNADILRIKATLKREKPPVKPTWCKCKENKWTVGKLCAMCGLKIRKPKVTNT